MGKAASCSGVLTELFFPACVPSKQGLRLQFPVTAGPGHLAKGLQSMKTLLVLLSVLGAAVAIPTNARFRTDEYNPTADSLSSVPQPGTVVTPEGTDIPILSPDDTDNEEDSPEPVEDQPSQGTEKPSIQDSKEESQDHLAEDDKNNSQEQGLKGQEESDSDLGETLKEEPTEGTVDLKEDTSEFPEEEVPENTFPPEVSPVVDTDPQEDTEKTEEEEEEERPTAETHPPLHRSSEPSQDRSEGEGNGQDANSPPEEENEEEEQEEEKESSPVGTHDGDREMEVEFPQEHSDSKQEEDSSRADDTWEESHQPTQVSKMQHAESEEENREEEVFNTEMREEAESVLNKHYRDSLESQEAKPALDVTGDHEETDQKAVLEVALTDPTGDTDMVPTHATGSDSAEDQPTPSQASVEIDEAQISSHHSEKEEQRVHVSENGGDTRGPEQHPGAKKSESSLNEDGSSSEGGVKQNSVDSCMNFQCKRGHMCKADPQGRPHCVCQDLSTCPPTKLLDQVCGTDNHTYPSSCHLFATKCRLEGTKKGHQLQLDYFGACKSIPACTDFEVTQFPLRMRDWLKNILMQLYESNPEHASYLNEKQRNKVKKIYLDEKRLLAGDHSIDLLLRDFKKNYHMYVYPVHWQFSELDQHPTDRVLTHSELAPLRASLVPMEHCITRFFEECDPNKDKHITLKEWGHCFGIKEEDIDENLLF